jgi:hypothetical protein
MVVALTLHLAKKQDTPRTVALVLLWRRSHLAGLAFFMPTRRHMNSILTSPIKYPKEIKLPPSSKLLVAISKSA